MFKKYSCLKAYQSNKLKVYQFKKIKRKKIKGGLDLADLIIDEEPTKERKKELAASFDKQIKAQQKKLNLSRDLQQRYSLEKMEEAVYGKSTYKPMKELMNSASYQAMKNIKQSAEYKAREMLNDLYSTQLNTSAKDYLTNSSLLNAVDRLTNQSDSLSSMTLEANKYNLCTLADSAIDQAKKDMGTLSSYVDKLLEQKLLGQVQKIDLSYNDTIKNMLGLAEEYKYSAFDYLNSSLSNISITSATESAIGQQLGQINFKGMFSQKTSLNIIDEYSGFASKYIEELDYLKRLPQPPKHKKYYKIVEKIERQIKDFGNAKLTAKELAILYYPYADDKENRRLINDYIETMMLDEKIKFKSTNKGKDDIFTIKEFIKCRKKTHPDEDIEIYLPEVDNLRVNDESKQADSDNSQKSKTPLGFTKDELREVEYFILGCKRHIASFSSLNMECARPDIYRAMERHAENFPLIFSPDRSPKKMTIGMFNSRWTKSTNDLLDINISIKDGHGSNPRYFNNLASHTHPFRYILTSE